MPRKQKKIKDPNLPKRPLSAYLFFCQEKRGELKEQQPDKSFTELAKLLGEKWREMSDEEKSKYVEMGERAKEEYKVALQHYNDSKHSHPSLPSSSPSSPPSLPSSSPFSFSFSPPPNNPISNFIREESVEPSKKNKKKKKEEKNKEDMQELKQKLGPKASGTPSEKAIFQVHKIINTTPEIEVLAFEGYPFPTQDNTRELVVITKNASEPYRTGVKISVLEIFSVMEWLKSEHSHLKTLITLPLSWDTLIHTVLLHNNGSWDFVDPHHKPTQRKCKREDKIEYESDSLSSSDEVYEDTPHSCVPSPNSSPSFFF
eukprot:CAMPEP_0174251592 /NCGR_PEP_ID=MMETSP0439-20130205/1359_1 /TAXON_ID=0 /ORGANISM="Stereomyxa ramosa, Strain Chinc5" /LENGTH=314 /DNA_ID=CAMNT_0015331935 /DNA_START=27 /DNA_END=971 /DNA_ORIENTATION=+